MPGAGEPHTTPAEGMCSVAQDAPSALHVEWFCPVGLTGAPDAGSVKQQRGFKRATGNGEDCRQGSSRG